MNLRFYPDPILKTVCRPLNQTEIEMKQFYTDSPPYYGRQLRSITDHMLTLMMKKRGCGLAAPQVGIPIRFFVMQYEGNTYRIFNPEIHDMRGRSIDFEGCLSIPGINANVIRARCLTLTGLDENMKPISVDARDFLARIIQHEFEHLDGKLFIEKISMSDLEEHKVSLKNLRERYSNKKALEIQLGV